LPVKAHIKEHPSWFHRFEAVWTPTVLLLDSEGKERARLEGYLPNEDFKAALEWGLGRIAFVHKKYDDAERWYGDVVTRFGRSHSAPGAMYWRAVARYKATHDHTVLGKVAEELRSTYPSSEWASKAIPWLAQESKRQTA
jgi:TolA-binding protein